MAFHGLPEEFQGCLAITALCDKAFQDFPFVIHSPLKVVVSPLIFRNTSSKCHCQFEYARIWLTLFVRISAANNGPNLFHQNRTVSWLMSMLRSCNRSSTFRSDNGNPTKREHYIALGHHDRIEASLARRVSRAASRLDPIIRAALYGWVLSIDFEPRSYGTHSIRSTKSAQILIKTGNMDAVDSMLNARS
jgi:hypothetical protein